MDGSGEKKPKPPAVREFRSVPERNGGHRTGFNARLRDELLSGELFRSMASEMMLRSMRQALKITSQPTNAEIKFSRSGLPRYTNAAGTLCLPSCGFSLDCF